MLPEREREFKPGGLPLLLDPVWLSLQFKMSLSEGLQVSVSKANPYNINSKINEKQCTLI
jgi:hypothetical protein